MAEETAEALVVAGNATVYVAPPGTALPDTEDETLDPDFVELGFTTLDGIQFANTRTVEGVRAHQRFRPIRYIVTEQDSTTSFSLMQWDADTVPLAFGGGEVTEPTPGTYRYDPPSAETIDERSVILDLFDGEEIWRFVLARCMVTSDVEATFGRTTNADLAITLGVMEPSGDDSVWYVLTNAVTMDPADS